MSESSSRVGETSSRVASETSAIGETFACETSA